MRGVFESGGLMSCLMFFFCKPSCEQVHLNGIEVIVELFDFAQKK